MVESEGVKIIYDADIERYVANSMIDYAGGTYSRGFYVTGASSC
jgi:Fe-S cluster assembly iron-binding protein IscA